MAKVKVTVVTPDKEEYDAEIEDTASDEEITASLVSGLVNIGVDLPNMTIDGRKLHYYLQLDKGFRAKAGSKLYIKSEAIEVASILGRRNG